MIKYLKKLFGSRELLIALTKREIKIRYKQTTLGAIWAILQPLSLMVIFTVVFSVFLKVDSQGVPYPLFSFSALLPWTFFATSISFGALSVINNSSLVSKVYFPREVLPLASLGAALLDFGISGVIFLGFIFWYKTQLTLQILWVFPIIATEIVFIAALLFFLSSLVVLWRDLKFIVPLVVQVWMYTTPVIYPISRVPENFRALYTLNPMAIVIDSFRRVTIMGKPPVLPELGTAIVVSVILFTAGYAFFKLKERVFADII
ncbi:MAG: ABC-2 type transporter [Candidatus Gottesmanbacteria bacterium GW2011_GWA1_43_11]|uniref:Transport permease protein n=1 Tax=Candidatus Gottesmanbacteria bacterium GW2011_GWA1_43_11 TaxID=1618436 RepID=A0A0G1EJQ4_9BACT|nr:MAG: ABC-2 type transporter [Candidatus Gottesmanbacteria bacterium GW2011_GWA1_43_11]